MTLCIFLAKMIHLALLCNYFESIYYYGSLLSMHLIIMMAPSCSEHPEVYRGQHNRNNKNYQCSTCERDYRLCSQTIKVTYNNKNKMGRFIGQTERMCLRNR